MFKYILFLLFLLCSSLVKAQSDQRDSLNTYQGIDLSYVFGGQVYNNNLVYNPGFSLRTSYGLMINESVGLGFGAGYYALQHEHFLPLFFEAMGYKKNKANTPVIKMQIGYSIGWYSGAVNIEGYKFTGGVFIDAGIGRKIPLNDRLSLLFQCTYRHQFARMEYEVYATEQYIEVLNFDMLVISLGLIRD
jgi:hypothetical protein